MNTSINLEEVKKTGDAIVNLSEDLTKNINQLNLIIDNLKSSWSGEDASIYISSITEGFILGLKQLSDVIENYGIYLQNIPDIYETIDSESSNESERNNYNA